MVVYGLGILPPIRDLRKSHPKVTQTWYSDGIDAGGTFTGIQRHLDNFLLQGPLRGYFPESTKSILVLSPQNVPQAEAFLRGYGIQVVTGIRYLGVFVGTEAAQDWWLEEKVDVWRLQCPSWPGWWSSTCIPPTRAFRSSSSRSGVSCSASPPA